jgi:peptide chain release factor 2
LVKDNRTGYEEVVVDKVMDGKIDGFINAFLAAEFNKNK